MNSLQILYKSFDSKRMSNKNITNVSIFLDENDTVIVGNTLTQYYMNDSCKKRKQKKTNGHKNRPNNDFFKIEVTL